MYVVILCSEEELPYHNAAADRVSVALCLFVVIDEFPLEEQNMLLWYLSAESYVTGIIRIWS